jgi:hypothetical protein
MKGCNEQWLRGLILNLFLVISLIGSVRSFAINNGASRLLKTPILFAASPLFSARNINENGEPCSDLQSTSTSIDGDAVGIRYRNDTDVNGDDDDIEPTTTTNGFDVASVMNSVTHWSDIMRQGSWFCENGTTALLLDSVLSDSDLNEIEGYWDRLMPTVSYLGTVQVAKIYKALCVAYRAHRGQMRKSGEPFIIHVRRLLYISVLYGNR